MLTLSSCLKEYKGIQFVLVEEAEQLVEKYCRANRNINNNVEYMLDDKKKNLLKITRDANGWCGDWSAKVATEKEYKDAIEETDMEIRRHTRITELKNLTKNLENFCSTSDMRLGQIIDVLMKKKPEIDLFNIENKDLNLLLEKFKNNSITQG